MAATLAAAAAVLVGTHSFSAGPSQAAAVDHAAGLRSAVQADIVRSDRDRVELAASSEAPDALQLYVADALGAAAGLPDAGWPSAAEVLSASRAEHTDGVDQTILDETLAVTQRVHPLGIDPYNAEQIAPLTTAQALSDISDVRDTAARLSLGADYARQCRLARELLRGSALSGILMWPRAQCAPSSADSQAVRRALPGLGSDATTPLTLAALSRIVPSPELTRAITAQISALTAPRYPDFLSSDDAEDLLVLAATTGRLPATATVRRFVHQQQMTRGALLTPGQTQGASVGYEMILAHRVLGDQPLISDPYGRLAQATDPVDAAKAAYEIYAAGGRTLAALERVQPAVRAAMLAYPGVPGLFLRGRCPDLAAASASWSQAVSTVTPGALTISPGLIVELQSDVGAFAGCDSTAGRPDVVRARAKVAQLARQAVTLGAAPQAGLAEGWAATRLACDGVGQLTARQVASRFGRTLAGDLRRAQSTDDLFFAYRVEQARRGICDRRDATPW